MKLNLECVRDILITIENHNSPMNMYTDEFCSLLPHYKQQEIIYCCEKLYEGNYLNLDYIYLPTSSKPILRGICDLTFQGHEFLGDIKLDSNWEKLSTIFRKGSSASFKTITNVAIALGTEAIKIKLGLKP